MTISYVVGHHFEIHNPFSADYLQQWGNTPTDLLAELDVVRRTSAYIIGRLEGTSVETGLVDGQLLDPDSRPPAFGNPL